MNYNKQTGKYESQYWHPALTADSVVFGYDGEELNLLLIRRGNDPYINMWALPGGFLREDDADMKACASRELKEETNIDDIPMEEFSTFSAKDRDSRERVVTVAFIAIVAKDRFHIIGGDDAKEAKWFPLNEVPHLAFDHDDIVKIALLHIKQLIHLKPIAFQLVGKEFTLQELWSIYKAIINPPLTSSTFNDWRNFRKKMLNLGYIKDTGKKVTGNAYRSPHLYTFDEKAYWIAKEKDDFRVL